MRKGKIMEGAYFFPCYFCEDGYTHILGKPCGKCMLKVKNHNGAIPKPSYGEMFAWVLSVALLLAVMAAAVMFLGPRIPLGQ